MFSINADFSVIIQSELEFALFSSLVHFKGIALIKSCFCLR